MLVLGLLLLGATAAFTGLLIAYNLSGGPDYTVALFGGTIATMNGLEIFLAGLALALIFCLAVAMTGIGGRLLHRRRALLRQARTDTSRPVGATSQQRFVPEPIVEAAGTGSSPAVHRRRHLLGH